MGWFPHITMLFSVHHLDSNEQHRRETGASFVPVAVIVVRTDLARQKMNGW